MISAVGRTISPDEGNPLYDLIQTDTSINPGNSGGPLVNSKGQFIGINTAIIRGTTRGGATYQGIGFAINAKTATQVTAHLADSGSVPWAWMGLYMKDPTPAQAASSGITVRHGVLITDVVQHGPGDIGGIQPGDIITSINNTPTPTVLHLIRILRQDLAAGHKVNVDILRNHKRRSTDLTLGLRPTS